MSAPFTAFAAHTDDVDNAQRLENPTPALAVESARTTLAVYGGYEQVLNAAQIQEREVEGGLPTPALYEDGVDVTCEQPEAVCLSTIRFSMK